MVKMTAKQQRAIAALVAGASFVDAAKAAGCGLRTLYTWRHENEAFAAELRNANARAFEQAQCTLADGMAASARHLVDVVEDENADPKDRINAARLVLTLGPAIREQTELAERVAALEAAQRSGKTAYDIKVGLFSGPAVVGMMGAPRRLNYTAVGEPVNVASRLESIPPLYGVRVVLGDSTANAVASAFFLRELDTITVKGRDVPLTIYEPLAPLDDVPRAARDLASAYADALAHYRRGDFGKAQTLWRQLADADPASARMAERCGALIGQPQQDGWDGIWRLSEK